MIPDKLDEKIKEARLIIPFIDENKNFFGYQGRSLDPNSKIRYITDGSILQDAKDPLMKNKMNIRS